MGGTRPTPAAIEHFTAYVRAIAAPIRAMIEQHAGAPLARNEFICQVYAARPAAIKRRP